MCGSPSSTGREPETVNLDFWEGELDEEGEDRVVMTPKYSGVWINFLFGVYGNMEIAASLDTEDGEQVVLRRIHRDANGKWLGETELVRLPKPEGA